jgi:pantoate--beta-alanine ligase
MVIFKATSALQDYLETAVGKNTPIGFIPTMGALHEGHLSLVAQAKNEGRFTVCSIFLNPTQFNDKSDFEKYPVSTDGDIALLLKSGCDVLFLPAVDEIYPDGTENIKTYDFGYLDTILEGANRPGHFKGVGQVVGRLLDIVKPDTLYLGQKDYQQCMVIIELKNILSLEDLKIEICPTLREADGLAMSSRNRLLTEPNRKQASAIYQCLVSIQAKQGTTPFPIVQKQCIDLLNDKGFTTEYVTLATNKLGLIDDYQPGTPIVALIAAKIGNVRLIDNLLL